MITHHERHQLTPAEVAEHMKAATLPIHFVVACADRIAAQLLAAQLGADWTITFEDKAPQVIECIGRRISEAILR